MPKHNSGPCKRRYARFDTSINGVLHGSAASEPLPCSVIDISIVGARLLTDVQLTKGAPFVLEFHGARKKTLRTPVQVCHSGPHAETGRFICGLQLVPETLEQRAAIAQFVSLVFQGHAG